MGAFVRPLAEVSSIFDLRKGAERTSLVALNKLITRISLSFKGSKP
jgi:hypothetical protein